MSSAQYVQRQPLLSMNTTLFLNIHTEKIMTTQDLIKRWAAAGIAACMLSLSSGCAVSPDLRAQTAPGAVAIAAGEGMVAVHVTGKRARLDTFNAKWMTLHVRNVQSKQMHALTDRADSSASHSLFLGNLPVGTYELVLVESQAAPGISVASRSSMTDAFPQFSIADGRMTKLGTVVLIPVDAQVDKARRLWGFTDSPLEDQAMMRQLAPAVADRMTAQSALGWNDSPMLEARRQDLAKYRGVSMLGYAPTRLNDGTLLLGDALGQIAVRNPAGQWRTVRTPAVLPIRALHAEGATIYAGSDDGILLAGKLDGSWNPIALPVPDATVIHIGRLPRTDELLVVLQTRDRFIGLSSSLSAVGTWREQFNRPRQLFSRQDFDASGVVYQAGERIMLATGSVEAKLEVLSYDASARTWTAPAPEGSGLPGGWAALPDGSLGRFRGIPLTGMYFAMSQNNGATWDKRGELNWANGPLLFVSDTTGYVVRTDSTPAFDASKFVLSLWRTDDAGRSWTTRGSTPGLAGKLVALGKPDAIGYVTSDGKFFSTADGGKTWKLEYPAP